MKHGIKEITEVIDALPILFEEGKDFVTSQDNIGAKLNNLLQLYFTPKIQEAINDSNKIIDEVNDLDIEEARALAKLGVSTPFLIFKSLSEESEMPYKLEMYLQLVYRQIDVVFDTIKLGKQIKQDDSLSEPSIAPIDPNA